MAPRRPKTSQSSRPSTTSTTADPASLSWNAANLSDPSFAFQQPHPPSGTPLYAQHELDVDEDVDSDDEDVFAYLPPVTAVGAADPQQLQSSTDSKPGLERIAESPNEDAHPHPPPPLRPLDTPSTGDQPSLVTDVIGPGEAFRMARLASTPVSMPVSSGRANSSREVHVSLPSRSSGVPDSSHQSKAHRASSDASTSIADIDRETVASSIKADLDDIASEADEDSPYPEVRASVSNIDDPSMPALTLRTWVIGLSLCTIAAGMNVFFNLRQPAPSVIALVLLLLAHPIGKLAAYAVPIRTWRLPQRVFGGLEFSFNPGPFNVKEHVLIFIMANVSITAPYAMNALVVAEVFYDMPLSFGFNLTLVLATQLTGFGLAGMCRRFLVWPASMIWPQNLVACALVNTLHAEDDDLSGGLSRYKFFMIAFTGAFVYFFLPGYLFTGLSMFSWACWIAPRNKVVNQLFGVISGLGVGFVTLDWAQISWIGSPLMVPWWAEVHVFAGFVLFYWILCPILYYTNVWSLSYFPVLSNVPYDKFGMQYNVSRILQNNKLNLTLYEEYSPLFMPAGWTITYLLAFAVSTCVIVHTALYHGRALLNGVKRIKTEPDDVHAKLMRNYPEVPDWWYLAFFIVFFLVAVVAVEAWHSQIPVWALLLALCLPVVYILPGGFIFAMTGQPITLNLLAQIIPGTLLPGNAFANMVFKTYAIQTHTEAIGFIQDLKLGHYIKVPPRATFIAQSTATILAAFVQVGVKQWLFKHVNGICNPHQKDALTCPHNQVFYTASVIWGVIGPKRQFGPGALYHPELYALIIGALIPFPFWLWQRRFPKTRLKYISMPVVINGVSQLPPATGINYSSWFIVAFIFQYFVRRTRFAWWSKYNYVLSAALDSGTVIGILVIFFCLQFPRGGIPAPNWWGNTVWNTTFDAKHVAFRTPPLGGVPS